MDVSHGPTLLTPYDGPQADVPVTTPLIKATPFLVKVRQVLCGPVDSSPETDGAISLRIWNQGKVSYTAQSLSGPKSGHF